MVWLLINRARQWKSVPWLLIEPFSCMKQVLCNKLFNKNLKYLGCREFRKKIRPPLKRVLICTVAARLLGAFQANTPTFKRISLYERCQWRRSDKWLRIIQKPDRRHWILVLNRFSVQGNLFDTTFGGSPLTRACNLTTSHKSRMITDRPTVA